MNPNSYRNALVAASLYRCAIFCLLTAIAAIFPFSTNISAGDYAGSTITIVGTFNGYKLNTKIELLAGGGVIYRVAENVMSTTLNGGPHATPYTVTLYCWSSKTSKYVIGQQIAN